MRVYRTVFHVLLVMAMSCAVALAQEGSKPKKDLKKKGRKPRPTITVKSQVYCAKCDLKMDIPQAKKCRPVVKATDDKGNECCYLVSGPKAKDVRKLLHKNKEVELKGRVTKRKDVLYLTTVECKVCGEEAE